MRTLLKLLLGFLGLLCLPSYAQNYSFKTYTVADGLVSTNITSILQDSKGYIWIATDAGVSRFDGYKFETFNTTNNLAHNRAQSLYEDKEGNIWIGCYGGFSRYRNGRIQSWSGFFDEEMFVQAFNQDKDGTLWIGTTNGVASFKDGQLKTYFLDTVYARNNYVYNIFNYEGKIIFGTKSGYYYFENGHFKHGTFGDRTKSLTQHVRSLTKDRQGNLWIATYAGLMRINQDGSIDYFDSANQLGDDDVDNVIMDREGVMWATTYRGLVRYREGSFEYIYPKGPASQVILDLEGNFWFYTIEGIVKCSRSNVIRPFDLKIGNEQFSSMFIDSKSRIWLGTTIGVVYLAENNNFRLFDTVTPGEKQVNSIKEDANGNIWFGAKGSGAVMWDGKQMHEYYAPKDTPFYNLVNTIYKDHGGMLWFTTLAGFYKWDGTRFHDFSRFTREVKTRFTCIYQDSYNAYWCGSFAGVYYFWKDKIFEFDPANLKKLLVTNIVEDKHKNLWISTNGNGLYKYVRQPDGSLKFFANFTSKSGLLSDLITEMLFDSEGFLWVGNKSGISKLDVRNQNDSTIAFVKHYNSEDSYGFSLGLFKAETMGLDQSGNLWIAAYNNIFRISLNQEYKNPLEPLTQITGVSLFNKDLGTQDSSFALENKVLEFDYDQNFLTFRYVGISLAQPAKVKYRYKLEGFDKDWSPETYELSATYSNIPPGNYTFMVIAANADGVWNKAPAAISIIVHPPFWATWWFRVMVAIVLVLSMVLIYRIQIRKVKDAEERKTVINKRIAGLQMMALRSQMNPHFVFNALNSVQHFILKSDAEAAYSYLAKFARLIRGILENSQKNFISLGDDINTLKLYLQLEQIRFQSKFEFDLDVDPRLNQTEIQVPPMIVQPFVENAILHGIMNKKGAGYITITYIMRGNSLYVTVEDDGVGRKRAEEIKKGKDIKHQSMGLNITQERLDILKNLQGAEARIETTDLFDEQQVPAGTRVEIILPIVKFEQPVLA